MKKTGEKLEILIDGDSGDDGMIMAVERVLSLLKKGYTSGADMGFSWDWTNVYKKGGR